MILQTYLSSLPLFVLFFLPFQSSFFLIHSLPHHLSVIFLFPFRPSTPLLYIFHFLFLCFFLMSSQFHCFFLSFSTLALLLSFFLFIYQFSAFLPSFLLPSCVPVSHISHCYSHSSWATINLHRADPAARPTSVTEVLCLREPPTTDHMAAWWKWAYAPRLCFGQLSGFCKQRHQPSQHLICSCAAWWSLHLCCQECPWFCPAFCHAQYLW